MMRLLVLSLLWYVRADDCDKNEYNSTQFIGTAPTATPVINSCGVYTGVSCGTWITGTCDGTAVPLANVTESECGTLCALNGPGCCLHVSGLCSWVPNGNSYYDGGSSTSSQCKQVASLPAGLYSMDACAWRGPIGCSNFNTDLGIEASTIAAMPACELPVAFADMNCDNLVSGYSCMNNDDQSVSYMVVKDFTSSNAECVSECESSSYSYSNLGNFYCKGDGWHPDGYYEAGIAETSAACANMCVQANKDGNLGPYDPTLQRQYASWRFQTDKECFCHLLEWSSYCENPTNHEQSVWYEYLEITSRGIVGGGHGCCQRDSSTGECKWSDRSIAYASGSASLFSSHCYEVTTVTGGDYAIPEGGCRLDEIINISSVETCLGSWTPENLLELQTRISNCVSLHCVAESFYPDFGRYNVTLLETLGPLNIGSLNPQEPVDWDVSDVTSMFRVFYDGIDFNQVLMSWDTSKVTTMEGMFEGALVFNQSLAWDVSQVVNFTSMFKYTRKFNQNLPWNTASAINFESMFEGALEFNKPLNWDTGGVTSMSHMFKDAVFNQPLAWDTSDVTDMSFMFHSSAFDQDISNWDTSSVTTMEHMFSSSPFNRSLEAWDVSNVQTFTNMFPLDFSITWCWEQNGIPVDLPNIVCAVPSPSSSSSSSSSSPSSSEPSPSSSDPSPSSSDPSPSSSDPSPSSSSSSSSMPMTPTPSPSAPAPGPSDAPAPGPFDAPAPAQDRLRASWEGSSVLVYFGLVSIVALPVLIFMVYQTCSSFRTRRYYNKVRQTR